MGKITINEIHKSLFGYIQAVSDESLETKDKTIVGAINELIQNSNKTEINNLTNEISNGKQLIANAIGEPLDSNDTFNAMSNDINGLLATFKTNMMNNGVTVESSDKFKQLIDKIAAMVEEGSGKGIQYAEGSSDVIVGMSESITIAEDIGFVPTIAFAVIGLLEHGVNYNFRNFNNAVISSCATTKYSANDSTIQLIISNESLQIKTTSSNVDTATGFQLYTNQHVQWYAIGVGEEDTTLSGGLDIISATELPNEVVNNQIVLITTNTPTDINVKDSSLCNPTTNGEINIGIVTVPDDSGVPYNITQNNIMMSLYLKVAKERVNNIVSTLNGYTGIGGQWVQFSRATFLVYDNGQDNYGISTSSNWSLSYASFSIGVGNIAVHINGHGDNSWQDAAGWFNKKFDLTNYSTLKITGTKHSSVTFGFSKSKGTTASVSKSFSLGTSSSEITVDISSLTGEYYLLVKGRSLTTTYAAASISRFELIP